MTQTYTSGKAGPMPEPGDLISRMRAALVEFETRHGAPVRSMKIHPDDLAALRAQCEPLLWRQSSEPRAAFNGVDLIPDEGAPRLRRAAP